MDCTRRGYGLYGAANSSIQGNLNVRVTYRGRRVGLSSNGSKGALWLAEGLHDIVLGLILFKASSGRLLRFGSFVSMVDFLISC